MESTASALDEAPLLRELAEVPGVLGCMLVSTDGQLLGNSLPADLSHRASAAAPRLAVLLEALAAGRAVQSFCLRFFEHRLHVSCIAMGFLCVLSELWTPSPVLKMAINVTSKRLS